MNFSLCLLGIFLLVLPNICEAKVLIRYRVADEIEKVYAERKKHDHHLGQIASLTQEERLEACKFYRAGNYEYDEESEPHMYQVVIPDDVILEKKKDETITREAESSRAAASAEKLTDVDANKEMEGEPNLAQLKPEEVEQEDQKSEKEVEEKSEKEVGEKVGSKDEDLDKETEAESEFKQLKMKETEQGKRTSKTKDEESTEPRMIYNLDIAFRCRAQNDDDEDFILSYGFAQEMFFVSEPVGELGEEKPFSGRKMKLSGYMFAPPIVDNKSVNGLHHTYYELRKRTEKIRGQSPTLMDDIEKHDDISALTFQEKNILCASIMEISFYKSRYQFIPSSDSKDFEYVKYTVGAFNHVISDYESFETDFMECRAKSKYSAKEEILGVTRSYAEGGTVFTTTIKPNKKNQFLEAKVTKIAVLYNRKYAGGREGVIEVLEAIRSR